MTLLLLAAGILVAALWASNSSKRKATEWYNYYESYFAQNGTYPAEYYLDSKVNTRIRELIMAGKLKLPTGADTTENQAALKRHRNHETAEPIKPPKPINYINYILIAASLLIMTGFMLVIDRSSWLISSLFCLAWCGIFTVGGTWLAKKFDYLRPAGLILIMTGVVLASISAFSLNASLCDVRENNQQRYYESLNSPTMGKVYLCEDNADETVILIAACALCAVGFLAATIPAKMLKDKFLARTALASTAALPIYLEVFANLRDELYWLPLLVGGAIPLALAIVNYLRRNQRGAFRTILDQAVVSAAIIAYFFIAICGFASDNYVVFSASGAIALVTAALLLWYLITGGQLRLLLARISAHLFIFSLLLDVIADDTLLDPSHYEWAYVIVVSLISALQLAYNFFAKRNVNLGKSQAIWESSSIVFGLLALSGGPLLGTTSSIAGYVVTILLGAVVALESGFYSNNRKGRENWNLAVVGCLFVITSALSSLITETTTSRANEQIINKCMSSSLNYEEQPYYYDDYYPSTNKCNYRYYHAEEQRGRKVYYGAQLACTLGLFGVAYYFKRKDDKDPRWKLYAFSALGGGAILSLIALSLESWTAFYGTAFILSAIFNLIYARDKYYECSAYLGVATANSFIVNALDISSDFSMLLWSNTLMLTIFLMGLLKERNLAEKQQARTDMSFVVGLGVIGMTTLLIDVGNDESSFLPLIYLIEIAIILCYGAAKKRRRVVIASIIYLVISLMFFLRDYGFVSLLILGAALMAAAIYLLYLNEEKRKRESTNPTDALAPSANTPIVAPGVNVVKESEPEMAESAPKTTPANTVNTPSASTARSGRLGGEPHSSVYNKDK